MKNTITIIITMVVIFALFIQVCVLYQNGKYDLGSEYLVEYTICDSDSVSHTTVSQGICYIKVSENYILRDYSHIIVRSKFPIIINQIKHNAIYKN